MDLCLKIIYLFFPLKLLLLALAIVTSLSQYTDIDSIDLEINGLSIKKN